MQTPLFRRVIVPVASKDDAAATTAALAPYADTVSGTIVVVYVVEKSGGAVDKASVEQRVLYADEIFDVVADGLADVDADLQTEYLYGTDVAETIIAAAHDRDASAIVFTPRKGGRWLRLLTGDVATSLVTESDVPVVVLPDRPAEESD
jgi:nucleotide-binding universal stress UspA family protein